MGADQTEQIADDQLSKRKMWELKINSIKFVDPLKGMAFTVGQTQQEHVITDIIRDVIDNEVVFMIYGEKAGETKLLKASVGIPVYITFKI